MSGHVYVVVSGFGRRIVPTTAPYRLTRDRQRIRVDIELAETWRCSFYDSSVGTSDDAADVTPGPEWNDWWLETTRYRIPFPDGWTAHASGDADPVAFDLVSPAGAMIYVQTPRVVPSVESLSSHGKTQRSWSDHVGDWLDVSYLHQNATWLQRYCIRHLDGLTAVVTAQSERSASEETMECHARVAAGIARQS